MGVYIGKRRTRPQAEHWRGWHAKREVVSPLVYVKGVPNHPASFCRVDEMRYFRDFVLTDLPSPKVEHMEFSNFQKKKRSCVII